MASYPPLPPGCRVEGNYKGRGRWYPGKIKKHHEEDNTYDVAYDDGDKERRMQPRFIRPLQDPSEVSGPQPLPPLPTEPPPRYGMMEKGNFWLPPPSHTEHESENQVTRRAQKYIVTMVEGCLSELQKHYMKSELVGKVITCAPFAKPVDLRHFPDYADFLKKEGREEMNLQQITRNLRTDKYGTRIALVLLDMKKVRDNAHAYNVGDENIETRLMADATYNYFHYLVKRCITALMQSKDEGVKKKVMEHGDLMSCLNEETAKDVLTYLKILDDEHMASWEAHMVVERQKRAVLEAQIEAQQAEKAAILQAEQEAYENEIMLMRQQQGPTAEEMEMDLKTQMEWGIDLAAESYGEPLTLNLGSKKKSKGNSNSNSVQMTQLLHKKIGWELTAENILQKLTKHPLVDMSKPDRVLTDFFHPVVDMYPALAEQYLGIVQSPMDLTMLTNQLNMGIILDAEEFYEKLSSVFLNLVKYNSRDNLMEHEKFAASEMVKKGNHLADYVKWLCIENFPVKSAEIEASSDRPEMLGFLRTSQVIAMRTQREEILMKSPMSGSTADCKKLLQALKRTKGKQETIAMSWFVVPPVMPSDYAVYVRKPMDLGTIQTKLDHGINKGHAGGYISYGDFLNDLRLTFQNSIKYNAMHLADEGSATVHKAATTFLENLEKLLPHWTVDVAEKCQREAISASREEQIQREQFERMLEEKRQLDAFAEQELARRLAEDIQFQEDMDVEKKKARTKEEKKEHDLHEALLRGDALQQLEEEQEQAEMEGSASVLPAFLKAVSELRIQGAGFNGQLLPHLIPYAQKKHELLEIAWEAWEPLRQHGAGYNKRTRLNDFPCLSPSSNSSPSALEPRPEKASTKRARMATPPLLEREEREERVTVSGKWHAARVTEKAIETGAIVDLEVQLQLGELNREVEEKKRDKIAVQVLFF